MERLPAPGLLDPQPQRKRVPTVAQLEEHTRLEVVRAAAARVVACRIGAQVIVARVLDVREHVGPAVADARQVEEPAFVDAGAIRRSHRALLPVGPDSRRKRAYVGRPRTRSCCRVTESTSFTSFLGVRRDKRFGP
jgi:hypothetical protein